ncbi:regulatory associated protein of mTOR [Schistosoma bovis]|uniref:Regulatory associated protein of mTOR n=1 Tax=Schistosoma bovis TaxID=6184 RepID=A0A430Q3U3_SCHBO|nr:regulatory associated protein of mTOR [Schistosoma bovis]
MLNPEMFLDSDTENDLMQDTVVAFTSRHLTEAIEGQVLYQEKYHKEKIKTLTVALVICLNIDIDPPDVQKIPPFSRVEAWVDPTDANSLHALGNIGKNLQIKTLTVALVICLNIDIDPPDVQKIPPFSRVEAWVDPTDANSLHALGNIGKNLQAQYERWQPRARYKQCLDPTLDDVKKLCLSLRRNAKDDRILFHYNGHGVPRPTENGEIWVFNTKFTKYIPLSLYDLQRWLGAPTVYVLDCQNAGRIIHIMENTFMLAACSKDEDLPQNPNLPADLFTACLTTPIRMALRWHWLRHQEYFPEVDIDVRQMELT